MAAGVNDAEPDVACAPDHDPDAVQPVALLDAQVIVVLAPAEIVAGLAAIETVGVGGTAAETDTVTLPLPAPPAPTQSNL